MSDYEKTRIAICCYPRPTEGEDIWRISSNEALKVLIRNILDRFSCLTYTH